MNSGSASKYRVMSTQDICALPIPQIADKNSALFLWATVPMIEDAFKVLHAWGHEYKTMLFWRKIMSLGMGFWFRGQVEPMLVGVRGSVKAFRIQKANIVQAKVREHSRKPDEFYELIELTGLAPRIELFACQRRIGWDAIGFDVDGKDIRDSLNELIGETGSEAK